MYYKVDTPGVKAQPAGPVFDVALDLQRTSCPGSPLAAWCSGLCSVAATVIKRCALGRVHRMRVCRVPVVQCADRLEAALTAWMGERLVYDGAQPK
jgi:hypothetical protein